MRDYGRVSPNFWTRGSGKKLRGYPDGQVVALYLFTCPAANMIGLYHLALPTMAHETGMTLDEAKRALAQVCAIGIAMYDPDEELVYLPEMAKYQIGDEPLKAGDKRVRGVELALAQIIRHPYAGDFIRRYKDVYRLSATPSEAPMPTPFEALHGDPWTPLEGVARSPLTPNTGVRFSATDPSEARSGKEQAKQGTNLSPPAPQPPAVSVEPPDEPQMSLLGEPDPPAPGKPKKGKPPAPPSPVTEVRALWQTAWTEAGMTGPAPWGADAATCAKTYLEAPGGSVETARLAIVGMLRTDAGHWHRTHENGKHLSIPSALAGKNVVAFTNAGKAWLAAKEAAARPKRQPPPPDPIPEYARRLYEQDMARLAEEGTAGAPETLSEAS